MATLSAAIVSLSLLGLAGSGVGGSVLVLLALLALIPASDAATALINRHVTNRFGPIRLPALELRDGVPPSLRTLVVVPTFLTTAADIEEQIERLEVRHLASSEDDLRFVLLSDWTDPSETAGRRARRCSGVSPA